MPNAGAERAGDGPSRNGPGPPQALQSYGNPVPHLSESPPARIWRVGAHRGPERVVPGAPPRRSAGHRRTYGCAGAATTLKADHGMSLTSDRVTLDGHFAVTRSST